MNQIVVKILTISRYHSRSPCIREYQSARNTVQFPPIFPPPERSSTCPALVYGERDRTNRKPLKMTNSDAPASAAMAAQSDAWPRACYAL